MDGENEHQDAKPPVDEHLASTLLSICHDYPKETLNRAFQCVGLLLLMTGWAVSSQTTQAFLAHTNVCIWTTLFLAGGVVAYGCGAFAHYRILGKVHGQLSALKSEWSPFLNIFRGGTSVSFGFLAIVVVATACDTAIWLVWKTQQH